VENTREGFGDLLIAAGGTGGHIFPALAVLEVLRRRHPEMKVTWVGSSHRMESTLIPSRGIEFVGLRQTEIRRGLNPMNILYNTRTLFLLIGSVFRSVGLIRRIRPGIILTTGGFAAGAAGLAAWMTRTPLAIIEPNAYPGLTNRFLGKRASAVFTAYPEAKTFFREKKTHAIGSPARIEVVERDRKSARAQLGLGDDTLMLLAMGGSQGAAGINRTLPESVKLISMTARGMDLRVVHQCGRGKLDQVVVDRKALPESRYSVVEFIDDIPTYLAAADAVVCRAGASTLSEVACRGLASVIVPYPFSAENHQVRNARAWESAGAALCIEESELNPSHLANKIVILLTDPRMRNVMGEKARKFGDPSAAEKIADIIEELAARKRVS